MVMIGPIGFAAPWLLWGLLALPALWILLRAVPPAPVRRRFPGVALLLGLQDQEAEAERMPWWLLLMRMLALAALIVGFAHPVLNPEAGREGGTAPLLVILDGGWADAPDWARRLDHAANAIADSGRAARPVAIIGLGNPPQDIVFQEASALSGLLAAMKPSPWAPSSFADWARRLPEGRFDTLWLSDGIAHEGRADLAQVVRDRGNLTVVEGNRPVLAIRSVQFDEGRIRIGLARLPSLDALDVKLIARGPDPAGIERELATTDGHFGAGAEMAEAAMDLPPEIRNRLTRFEIGGQRSVAAVHLADDSLRQRKVALISGGTGQEGLALLSPYHYLREALSPFADLIETPLADAMPAGPDTIILTDAARLSRVEREGLLAWVEKGGVLLRFAGPRLAADPAETADDPLMPVRLREGDREVGGAMSWGEPRKLASFPDHSPFHGLTIPDEVQVTRQVLAQPGPELAARTIAALEDGTPLVTRKALGEGQVALFHVTANADWSNLPLSGLFVDMLERLTVATRPDQAKSNDLIGQVWVPEILLDAWGEAHDAGNMAGIPGTSLAEALETGPGPARPPGLYASNERRIALNVIGRETILRPAEWPAGTNIEGFTGVQECSLAGPLLALGLGLLILDVLASLLVAGRLWIRRGALLAGGIALSLLAQPQTGWSDPNDSLTAEDFAIRATDNVVLAYVRTGDEELDRISRLGLTGLGDALWQRTSVEPEPPMGVDINKDELAFFPFLYWPITADAPLPTEEGYAQINRFLRTGGLILFDTRDGDAGSFGQETPEGRALQRIAAGLDIPPLEPIPPDHVLSRTFYLLQTYPGRQTGGSLWVEAAPSEAVAEENMPFRILNDGVTPVVIGGNDWAAAWAVDESGVPYLPVGRGAAGDQQREVALRFGINLIMHVLTGNYKSDQVHVPALLERLGQERLGQ